MSATYTITRDADGQVVSVQSRPHRSAVAAWWVAAVILVVFLFTAVVMMHDNAGVHFMPSDRFGTAVIGIIIAGAALMPTRPRLDADVHELRLRAFLGAPRVVPWAVVTKVEFPRKLLFARVVLPADETFAIYAVQRMDHDQSVEVMRALRELYSLSHAGVQS